MVRVVDVAPESRDLVVAIEVSDGDGPEPVLVERVRKYRQQFVGTCVGRQIPVSRLALQKGIPQGAPNHVGCVTGRPQRGHQFLDGRRDLAVCYAVWQAQALF